MLLAPAAMAQVQLTGWPTSVKPPSQFTLRKADPAELVPSLSRKLARAGYPAAQLVFDTLSGQWRVSPGAYFVLDSLSVTGVTSEVQRQVRRFLPRLGPWYPDVSEGYIRACLQALGEEGFPYAVASQPRITYTASTEDTVRVQVHYDISPGVYLVWGLPELRGEALESPRWMAAHVGLWPGTAVNARTLQTLAARVEQGGRYTLDSVPTTRIREEALTLKMKLKRQPANRFDALVGLLPPRGTQTDWLITALIDLQLTSALRLGERLSLNYQQFPQTSRLLDVSLELPYLAGSAFSGSLGLRLFKQDSTFSRLSFEPRVRYLVTPQLSAELFLQLQQAGLLNVEPYSETVWPPPPVLDSRASYTGIGIRYDSRNRPVNPTGGLFAYLSYGLGSKNIKRTVGLDSLDYSRLALDQPKQEIKFELDSYHPLGRQTILRLATQGYWLKLAEYFDSDLAQLGGARSLRGFNENQFLASSFIYATAEYRLLLGGLAYMGVFVDVGYLETRTLLARTHQWPRSAGFTLSVDTRAGLVNVSYAVGTTAGQSFQLARGRVHIGYTASF